jgi:hypothetical protein
MKAFIGISLAFLMGACAVTAMMSPPSPDTPVTQTAQVKPPFDYYKDANAPCEVWIMEQKNEQPFYGMKLAVMASIQARKALAEGGLTSSERQQVEAAIDGWENSVQKLRRMGVCK